VIFLERVHRLLKLGRPFILGIFAKRADTASREYSTMVEVLLGSGVLMAESVVAPGAVDVLRLLMGSTGDLLVWKIYTTVKLVDLS
jgi:hypothetical protein